MAKRYITTTKSLITISFSAEDDKEAEETFQRIIKHLRENAINHDLDNVQIEVDPDGWHTQFYVI